MLAAGKVVGLIPTKVFPQNTRLYQGNLGFPFVNEDQFARVDGADGTTIRIAKKVENFAPAQYTVLGGEVCTISQSQPDGGAAWVARAER